MCDAYLVHHFSTRILSRIISFALYITVVRFVTCENLSVYFKAQKHLKILVIDHLNIDSTVAAL